MLASCAAFGTSGTFATSLLDAGWSPGACVILRVGIAALALTVFVVPSLRRHGAQVRRSAGLLTVYGVFAVAGAQLCYFNAVEHLSVAVALLLEYSGTLLVVLWMWLRHQHRPNVTTVAGALAATAGLALVLDVFGDVSVDVVGVAWGLGAAVGLAVYFVIAASTDDGLPPLVTAWCGLVVGGIVLGTSALLGALTFTAETAQVTLLDQEMSWLVPLLGMSLVAGAFAYFAGVVGARSLGAKVASFVGLTEVLFAVLFAWVLIDESLGAVQLVGGVLVVAGIVLVKLGEPAVAVVDDVSAAAPPGRATAPRG